MSKIKNECVAHDPEEFIKDVSMFVSITFCASSLVGFGMCPKLMIVKTF